MPSAAIIPDTDSSVPAEVAARHGIRQVPITLHLRQETIKIGEEIDGATPAILILGYVVLPG
jgi:fatty acid-binding protein DegV